MGRDLHSDFDHEQLVHFTISYQDTREPAPTRPSKAGLLLQSNRCWIGPGQTVEVGGFTIEGGLVYVGSELDAVGARYGLSGPDPCCIDPSLPVEGSPAHEADHLGYWPSYSEISSSSRATYLSWLAGGRRDPSIDIGYVFLFYYGLERRVLFDAQHLEKPRADVPAIREEVRRLLELYGENHSFSNYATSFLDYLCLHYGLDTSDGYQPHGPALGWRMPVRLKLEIARHLVDGEAIGPDLALSWFLTHPSTSLRTPGRRCRRELEELFALRYPEHFGAGLKVRPNKTRLATEYYPASGGLERRFHAEHPDLPDVEPLQAPLKKLSGLVEAAQDELDRYSRWVGRYEEGSSLEALALLPPPLVRPRLSEEHQAFLHPIESRLGNGVALVPTGEVITHWPAKKPGKLYKKEAEKLAAFLQSIGIGIEPDVRFGSPNPSKYEQFAVFALDPDSDPPAEGFAAATLLLHLGAAVAAADDDFGPEEEALLEARLEETFDLSSADRNRLQAHLKWLASTSPDSKGLGKRADSLSTDQRKSMGRFLIALAAADGRLDPREIEMLEKIYPQIGLDAATVHSELHSLAARGAASGGAATDPVTVVPGESARVFSIPEVGRPEGATQAIELDRQQIAAIKADSRKAAELLHSIFSQEEDSENGGEPAATTETSKAGAEVDSPAGSSPLDLLRLEASTLELVRTCLARPSWPRQEIDSLALEHGLMTEGTIEIVNERTFEIWDEPLFEGEDPVEINEYLVELILAEEEE